MPKIALRIVQTLPRSFDRADLEQVGNLAIIEAGPRVEAYLRMRIRGAMIDSAKDRAYREARHVPITCDPPDKENALTTLIDEESRAEMRTRVRTSIERLPADQARVIATNYGFDGQRGRGKPRKVDVIAEREGLEALRVSLAEAA